MTPEILLLTEQLTFITYENQIDKMNNSIRRSSRLIRKLFTLSFFLPVFSSAICQEGKYELYQNGYYIKQYSEIAGLVFNGCRITFRDSKGFLWISTFKGLSRFDGLHFINYGIKEGLPGTFIVQVSEDTSGYIYVATSTGIARYTGRSRGNDTCFYTYPQTSKLSSKIAGMEAIDSASIIFQQDDGAVLKLQNGKLVQLTGKEPGHWEMLFKDNFNVYVFSGDTMRVFDKKLKNTRNLFTPASAVSSDYRGNLHVSLYNGVKQRLDDRNIAYRSSVPDSILWFASLDTLDKMIYYKSGAVFFHDKSINKKIVDMDSLSLICNGFSQSNNNKVWMQSSSGGIFRFTPLPYTTSDLPISGYYFRENGIRKIVETSNRLSGIPGMAATFNLIRKISRVIFVSKNGTVWFCTNNGIYKQVPRKKPEHFIFPADKTWNLNPGKIYGAAEDSNGDMWFYGICGAVRYSKSHFTHYTSSNGLSEYENVRQLEIDRFGTILMSDDNNILLKVQGDTLIQLEKELGIPNLTVDRIKTDGKGFVWFDYNKKLFKIAKQPGGNYSIADSIILYSLNVLPEVSAFAFDGQGNCWVGYAGGKMQVYFADPKGHYNYTNSITYTEEDGLAPMAAFGYDLWPDQNGDILVIPFSPGNKKTFVFSIKDALERKKMATSPVILTDILINDKMPDWKSMGYSTGPAGFPSSCKLPYRKNNITFGFTGVFLDNNGSTVYRTMLKGFDREWKTTRGLVNYTNLPSGDYVFIVKAANANGTWGDVFEYHFTILPPWYKTWWAMLLWALTAISIIVFIFYLRLNAVRMSHLEESNVFKTSLIGLIGHDMMTPLGYIAKVSLQLRVYYEKLTKKTAMDSLGDINTTASQLQYFGESIIHWIKIQSSEFSPVLEEFQVSKTITELVDFHHPLAAEKKNDISYDVSEDLYCCQDPTLVRIIVHNLLLNANKFTSVGNISILAVKENDWLIIHVKDSGRGMDPDRVNTLNHLHSIRSTPGTQREKGWGMGYKVIIDLLKFCKGSLQVKSKINEGTEVIIKFPSGERQAIHKRTGEFSQPAK